MLTQGSGRNKRREFGVALPVRQYGTHQVADRKEMNTLDSRAQTPTIETFFPCSIIFVNRNLCIAVAEM